MAVKKRIKNLSVLSRQLLAEGESVRADFKRAPDGISADDLVAFANSEKGGQILAGIDEVVVDKAQIGVVRGCDVSDGAILQILNKAVSCIPPVSIEIYIENLDERPILRVEVQSSQTKPHCTPKGIYCRRDGARNRPLHPGELLRLFLESEAASFAEKFEVAAERISSELRKLESSLDNSISNMADQLGWAEYQMGDTESTLDNIQAFVAKLSTDTANANSRLRTLFRQDNREDPVRQRARIQYGTNLVSEIKNNKNLFKHVVAGGKLTLTSKQPEDSDMTDDDASQMLEIAIKHIYDTERDKKYQIVVKSPKTCNEDEIDRFSSKVIDGGEVGEGIHNRVKRAFQIGYILYDNSIIGTAALKKPSTGYRSKVFKKAGTQLTPSTYPYELGWIFLDPPHRQKGQMTRLIDELLPAAKGSALFATTRKSNAIMREMLVQLGFSEEGIAYESEQNPQDTLNLFVRAELQK